MSSVPNNQSPNSQCLRTSQPTRFSEHPLAGYGALYQKKTNSTHPTSKINFSSLASQSSQSEHEIQREVGQQIPLFSTDNEMVREDISTPSQLSPNPSEVQSFDTKLIQKTELMHSDIEKFALRVEDRLKEHFLEFQNTLLGLQEKEATERRNNEELKRQIDDLQRRSDSDKSEKERLKFELEQEKSANKDNLESFSGQQDLTSFLLSEFVRLSNENSRLRNVEKQYEDLLKTFEPKSLPLPAIKPTSSSFVDTTNLGLLIESHLKWLPRMQTTSHSAAPTSAPSAIPTNLPNPKPERIKFVFFMGGSDILNMIKPGLIKFTKSIFGLQEVDISTTSQSSLSEPLPDDTYAIISYNLRINEDLIDSVKNFSHAMQKPFLFLHKDANKDTISSAIQYALSVGISSDKFQPFADNVVLYPRPSSGSAAEQAAKLLVTKVRSHLEGSSSKA